VGEVLGLAKMEAGSPTAINWCISAVRKGGNVSIIGVYGPPWNLINIGSAMNKGLTLRMNQCNVRRYMPHLLEHIREGRINAKGIITHRFPLEDAPHAYHLFHGQGRRCPSSRSGRTTRCSSTEAGRGCRRCTGQRLHRSG
jgi:threonine dehydrogenase-like Zn-dependent dehydrogenase